ncbi:MAG TPA: hypothetical protein VMT15_04565 [Bryobacteraceae bacterium]|nr:hypothetical protein [Bryobacteraceae bacterium]
MDPAAVRAKFGLDYIADERTYTMGIDRRFTAEMARRFRNRVVLETCTGAGFTTIALARVALLVITFEIQPAHQAQARFNLAMAGVMDRVTSVLGDVMKETLPQVDAAFLDPDWAVTGLQHVHRFLQSTTKPPADALVERVFRTTQNVALVLPPGIDPREFDGLPVHERQKLYMDRRLELYCLYFGQLAESAEETEFRA